MSTDQISQPNIELLTGKELDRQLEVAQAIVQLQLVSGVVSQGLVQPHMQEFDRIYQDHVPGFRRGGIVVPKNQPGVEGGGFAAFLNGKYGSQSRSYEIDYTHPTEPKFLVRPIFDDWTFWQLHDPENKREIINVDPFQTYSPDEFVSKRLPMNHTDMFLRVASRAYQYARRNAMK